MKDLNKWVDFWSKQITEYHPIVKPLGDAIRAIMGIMVMMNEEIEALKQERDDAP